MNTEMKNQSFLDILFEGKNKLFGAYVLRKEYNFRMLKSGVIALLFVSGLFMTTMLPGKDIAIDAPYEIPDVVVDRIVTITPKKPKKVEPEKRVAITASKKARKVKQFTAPKIVANSDVKPKDKLEKIEKDEKVIVGNKSKLGDLTEFDNMRDGPKGKIDGDKGSLDSKGGGGEELVQKKKPAGPVRQVQQKAEYIGDIASLLHSNLRYPKAAEDQGIQGKVMVEFVINEDGSISNVKVLRKLGGGCSEEAIRVVKMMKKWKPGIVNGKEVASYFVMPITFKLN